MKTNKLKITSIKKIFIYIVTINLASCGSFQFSSYYSNDGIYHSEERINSENQRNIDNNYYTQYFKNIAQSGIVNSESESLIFTDVDSYNSISPYQDEEINYNSSQNPWEMKHHKLK